MADTEGHLCDVCGLPLEIGQQGCISTIRPHGPLAQPSGFTAYFDVGLGEYVTSLGQRHQLMRRNKLDYRDKMSPGDVSARRDREHERQRARP
jgi:hypothetical protein